MGAPRRHRLSLSLLDFTTSPNFRNFQETEKKDQWNCKGASRGERKKAPSTPFGAADATLSKPGHIANAKHRNEIFRVIIVSDPFGDRSSVIISVESIDLTFVFFYFSFVVFLVRKLDNANCLLSYR